MGTLSLFIQTGLNPFLRTTSVVNRAVPEFGAVAVPVEDADALLFPPSTLDEDEDVLNVDELEMDRRSEFVVLCRRDSPPIPPPVLLVRLCSRSILACEPPRPRPRTAAKPLLLGDDVLDAAEEERR